MAQRDRRWTGYKPAVWSAGCQVTDADSYAACLPCWLLCVNMANLCLRQRSNEKTFQKRRVGLLNVLF